MVDPNRKINRLTEDHVQFLDEIEEEFADRFSSNDEEFRKHCAKPPGDPPVVPNWNNASKQRFNHAPQRYRNNRDWAYRRDRGGGGGGGGGGHGRHHHRRSNHYEGRSSNGGGGGHRGGGHQPRSHPPRREENFAPMNIPRNYANFVAASKD